MIKLLWILCAVAAADCEGQSCQKNVTRDHLLLQRKVTSKMSKVAGNSNSTDSTGQCDKEFVNLGSDGEPGMTECQGDCDEDSDCAPGLRCKQRRWNEEVPGCHGHSYARMDYCYNPSCESMPELDSSYGSQGAANMPKCAGDCDEDSDCAGTLKCFQRDGRQAVPGCAGSGVPDFDYCYETRWGLHHNCSTFTTRSGWRLFVCLWHWSDLDRKARYSREPLPSKHAGGWYMGLCIQSRMVDYLRSWTKLAEHFLQSMLLGHRFSWVGQWTIRKKTTCWSTCSLANPTQDSETTIPKPRGGLVGALWVHPWCSVGKTERNKMPWKAS